MEKLRIEINDILFAFLVNVHNCEQSAMVFLGLGSMIEYKGIH